MDFNFTIYSLGDAAFLYTVLNAVSSIPESTYMQLGGIGAILGLLIMGVKGVTEGNLMKAGFQGLLVSLALFWIMFVARVDEVVVRDMAPSPSAPPLYVVDNVPAGFAAVGAVTSGVGVFIARLFDQAFADVDGARVLSGGIGDNLRRITVLRQFADPIWVEASGNVELNLYRENLGRYLAQCSMTGLTTGEKTNRTLMTKEDVNQDGVVNALDGMHFPHRAIQVRLRLKDGGNEVVSCADGPKRINEESGFNPASSAEYGDPGMERAFNSAMGDESGRLWRSTIDVMKQFGMPEGAQWGQATTVNQLAAAATAYANRTGDTSVGGRMGAMMVEEAAARRNVQFAGEQNIFLRTMRSTIGFFEAVFYALGPVMAILVMTGPTGLTIASKYVLMTVWVLLWYPMLAIINLYGNVRMQSLVTELASNADYLTTPMGTHQLLVMAQDQLGTIGGLVAATPLLAMSLIYGGAVAMNSVASRLSGGDQLNEGMVAPQGMDTAPAMKAGPIANASVGSGLEGQGARDISMAGSQLSATAVQSARQEAQSDASSLMRQWGEVAGFGKQFSIGGGTSNGTQEGRLFGEALGSTIQGGGSYSAAFAEALNLLKSADGQVGFEVSASGGLKAFGMGAAAETNATGSESTARSELQNAINTFNASMGKMDQDGLTFARNLGETTSTVLTSSGATVGSDQQTTALIEAASSTRSSVDSYSELDSLTNQSGISESAKLANVEQTMASSNALDRNFQKYERLMADAGPGTREAFQDAYASLKKTGSFTESQARLGAYWAAAEAGGADANGTAEFRQAVTRDALMVTSGSSGPAADAAGRWSSDAPSAAIDATPSVVTGGPLQGAAGRKSDAIIGSAEATYDQTFDDVEAQQTRVEGVVNPRQAYEDGQNSVEAQRNEADKNFETVGLGGFTDPRNTGTTKELPSKGLDPLERQAVATSAELQSVSQREAAALREAERLEVQAVATSTLNPANGAAQMDKAAALREDAEQLQKRRSEIENERAALPAETRAWADARVAEVGGTPAGSRAILEGDTDKLVSRVRELDERAERSGGSRAPAPAVTVADVVPASQSAAPKESAPVAAEIPSLLARDGGAGNPQQGEGFQVGWKAP